MQNIRIRTQARATCYLCGGGGILLYQDLEDKLFDAPGRWNVRKCVNNFCGLIWLDPVPEEDEIGRLYEAYYTHQGVEDGGKRIEPSEHSFNSRGMTSIASSLINQKRLLKHRRASRKIYDRISPGENVLEVGCGKGEFLNYMKGKGKKVSGVDTDEKACEYARKKYDLDVFPGRLEDAGFAENSFDTVMMNHVIEHILDPVGLLIECRRVLKPGGKLALITPNCESIGHAVFKENWLGLEAPRHIHLFSNGTLKALVRKAKFSDTVTFGISGHDLFFYWQSWLIKNRQQHRHVGQKSWAVNSTQAALLRYYGYLASRKDGHVGEQVGLICRK